MDKGQGLALQSLQDASGLSDVNNRLTVCFDLEVALNIELRVIVVILSRLLLLLLRSAFVYLLPSLPGVGGVGLKMRWKVTSLNRFRHRTTPIGEK